MKVHIVGGGIIGLCTAWYLKEAGFEVVVIDKTDLSDGCSHGNAGLIVPSHFVPLASPGVISKGIKWMFDSKSPFFIKPRLNLELTKWLWQFYRSCNPKQVKEAMPLLRDFNLWSKSLYQEFTQKEGFDFSFEDKGMLIPFQDSKTEKEELQTASKALELGLKVKILSESAVKNFEKGTQLKAIGGVFYEEDAHLNPSIFIKNLVAILKKKGVQFLSGQKVLEFQTEKNSISKILFENGEYIHTENIVLTAGSWSSKLLKKLNIHLSLQDGKGYSWTIKNPKEKPTLPTILSDAKVAITPMGNDLRIGGTLEISNFSPKINMQRVKGILGGVKTYYPKLKIEMPAVEEVWHGFRPCTPDGLPYIGRSSKFNNLTIATGHAMMGMSLGPATGKLVAEILSNQKTSLDIRLLNPERF